MVRHVRRERNVLEGAEWDDEVLAELEPWLDFTAKWQDMFKNERVLESIYYVCIWYLGSQPLVTGVSVSSTDHTGTLI